LQLGVLYRGHTHTTASGLLRFPGRELAWPGSQVGLVGHLGCVALSSLSLIFDIIILFILTKSKWVLFRYITVSILRIGHSVPGSRRQVLLNGREFLTLLGYHDIRWLRGDECPLIRRL